MQYHARKPLTLLLTLLLCLLLLTGCSTNRSNPTGGHPSANTPKRVLLVVRFGTSYNENRELSIAAIEKA